MHKKKKKGEEKKKGTPPLDFDNCKATINKKKRENTYRFPTTNGAKKLAST